MIPENEQDRAYIEDTLGLRKRGDHVRFERVNAAGLSCVAYVESKRPEPTFGAVCPACEGHSLELTGGGKVDDKGTRLAYVIRCTEEECDYLCHPIMPQPIGTLSHDEGWEAHAKGNEIILTPVKVTTSQTEGLTTLSVSHVPQPGDKLTQGEDDDVG